MRLDTEQLEKFTCTRNELIDQLELGILNKSTYLEAQYQALLDLGAEPFRGKIRSVEEGLFNYQYYNTFAKRERILCKAEEYRNPEKSREHRRNADRYYDFKDRETKKILEFCGIKNVIAYKILTPAKYLQGKLLEILLPDVKRGILHTADEGIYNLLDRAGVLEEELKVSAIQDYIEADYDSV